MRQPVRFGHSGPVGYGSGPYRGLKVGKVATWHKNLSTVMGTIMWLWLFWRAKNDGPALLVRMLPAMREGPSLLRINPCSSHD